MSKTIKNDLFGSLKETFRLGVQEFSRSLTGTLPQQANAKTTTDNGETIIYDNNQISRSLDTRESDLHTGRF